MIIYNIFKLLVLFQTIKQSLSSNVVSFFTNTTKSILIVTYNYTCHTSITNQNPFQTIDIITQHLITDYKSANGMLSNKPSTLILHLRLLPADSLSPICHIGNKTNIYNPFVYGKDNGKYSASRKTIEDKCCTYLESVYDLQLIIESGNNK